MHSTNMNVQSFLSLEFSFSMVAGIIIQRFKDLRVSLYFLLLSSLLTWLGDFFFPLQELPSSSLLAKIKLSLLMVRLKLKFWFVVTSAWQNVRQFSTTSLSIFLGQGHIQQIISITGHWSFIPLSAELLTVWWFNCNCKGQESKLKTQGSLQCKCESKVKSQKSIFKSQK